MAETAHKERGRTIREAIAVALEGLNGDLFVWVVLAKQRDAMRAHVVRWVHEYARNRNVILSDDDINSELAVVIGELRDGIPLRGRRYEKVITFCGQRAKVACDGNCEKAWGTNGRPRVMLGAPDDLDDYAWLADHELGRAPDDPGTYEGDHGKPVGARGPQDMNKWCVRECERCVMSEPREHDHPLKLRDLSRRFYNKAPHRRD